MHLQPLLQEFDLVLVVIALIYEESSIYSFPMRVLQLIKEAIFVVNFNVQRLIDNAHYSLGWPVFNVEVFVIFLQGAHDH